MTKATQPGPEGCLAPTWFLDFEDEAVAAFAEAAVGPRREPVAVAEALFYAVRDGLRYDPYRVSTDPADYRASAVARSEANWCTPKSVLFAAAARRSGVPARLGFADVRNHLTSPKLRAKMGTDVFAWHGYAELWLSERWVKLSTAFNKTLCERFGVKTLEFDPVEGALFHPFDVSGARHMEYVLERGSYAELPLETMLASFREVYPSMMGNVSIPTRPAAQERDEAFH